MREKLDMIEDLDREIAPFLNSATKELENLQVRLQYTADEISNLKYIITIAMDKIYDASKVLTHAQDRAQDEFDKNMKEMEKNESTRTA